jgi:hypothetical protein
MAYRLLLYTQIFIIMKHWIIPVLVIFLTGCNEANTPAADSKTGDIAETILPKGKYVLEDDIKSSTLQTTVLGNAKNNTVNLEDTAATKEDVQHILKHRFKNLMLFHANDTMKINKSYLATLILGKDQIVDELKTEILPAEDSASNNIKQDTSFEIGTKMKARLIDMSGAQNKGFAIELIGGEEAATQNITEKRKKTIWQWKLTPQTPGLQELKLSINVIEKNGEIVNLPARNIPVMIFAEQEGFFASIGSFFKNEHTRWLLSAILIPVFLGWYTTKRKNKKDDKNIKA